MAYTFFEASKVSNEVLSRGVIEMITEDDPIIPRLPVMIANLKAEIEMDENMPDSTIRYRKYEPKAKKFEVG